MPEFPNPIKRNNSIKYGRRPDLLHSKFTLIHGLNLIASRSWNSWQNQLEAADDNKDPNEYFKQFRVDVPHDEGSDDRS